MSWPFGPSECPRCRYFSEFDEPDYDDSGYEVVGLCRHPRIGMALYRSQRPNANEIDSCPCFSPQPEEEEEESWA